jgi:hypothetical protein
VLVFRLPVSIDPVETLAMEDVLAFGASLIG